MDDRFVKGEKIYKGKYKRLKHNQLIKEAQEECIDIGNYIRFLTWRYKDKKTTEEKQLSAILDCLIQRAFVLWMDLEEARK